MCVCVCKRWGVCSYSVCSNTCIHVQVGGGERKKYGSVVGVCVCARARGGESVCVCARVCVFSTDLYMT